MNTSSKYYIFNRLLGLLALYLRVFNLNSYSVDVTVSLEKPEVKRPAQRANL